MEAILGTDLLCKLDSLRFIIERNPGSVVILAGAAGFLFWRSQKFLWDGLWFLFRKAPLGKAAKEAVAQCSLKGNSDRKVCIQSVAKDRFEKAWEKITWLMELFLNIAALVLVVFAGLVCYLIISPPMSCDVPGSYRISVPAVFKKIYNKGGEILYADETNRSYVRIWPGTDEDFSPNGPSADDLIKRYQSKKAEAAKNMVPSKSFEEDKAPKPGSNYFVVSWRDRDNFDVYFVARLVGRQNGKSYIDSLEISSPVHGNALMGYDYRILFCNFVSPSTSDKPKECREL